MQNKSKQIIKVFPAEGISNSFVLYNDDGVTEDYKKGSFSELYLTLEGNNLKATINGTKDFLANSYKIINAVSGKEQTVSLAQLLEGIEL